MGGEKESRSDQERGREGEREVSMVERERPARWEKGTENGTMPSCEDTA